MKTWFLLSTLIISVTCSFAVESNDSFRAYQELFPAGAPEGRVKMRAYPARIDGDEYAEYEQGMPIVIYMNLYIVPAQRKQQTRNNAANSTPLALGNTTRYWPIAEVSSKQDNPPPPVDTKVYISKAWKQNIKFTLNNAESVSVGTNVSPLEHDEGLDNSIVELTTEGIPVKWVIEGEQTKNYLPGKYTLTISLGPISLTNVLVIAEYKGQQKAVFKVSNAYVSFLRGEYNEAIDLANDAISEGGRMVNDRRNHAIEIMALSYERLKNYKEALQLWEEFQAKSVSDVSWGKISDMKEMIKKN